MKTLKMLKLALRVARQEFRGKISGFTIFVLCLTLGVMSVVSVRSMTGSILSTLERDGKQLLGADVSLRTRGAGIPSEVSEWLENNSEFFSQILLMRTLVVREDDTDQVLVNLQLVDDHYPLYGEVLLDDGSTAQPDAWGRGLWIAKDLSLRLGIGVGDNLRLGLQTLPIAGVVDSLPDRNSRLDFFGSRVLLGVEHLEGTGLLQQGSLVRYTYKMRLQEGDTVDQFMERLNEAFPEGEWQAQTYKKADPNLERGVKTIEEFMTLIALTILLIGGIGIGNAARSFLGGRLNAIATLKSLGASRGLVVSIYMLLLLFIGFIGSIAGSVLGALMPYALLPIIASVLPFASDPTLSWSAIFIGISMGLLVELIFVVIALSLASKEAVSRLFRHGDGQMLRGNWSDADLSARIIFVASIALLLILVWFASANEKIVVYFLLGTAGIFSLFFFLSQGLLWALRNFKKPKTFFGEMLLGTLRRPGNMTVAIFMSLGLGFSVLSSIGMIQGSVERQISDIRAADIPLFFLVDVQAAQKAKIETLLAEKIAMDSSALGDSDGKVDFSPIIRGRILSLAGRSADEIEPPSNFSWVLEGDRAITWDDTPSFNESNSLVEGEWWQAGYEGELLVSFDAGAATAFGLKLGDEIGIRVLGRYFTAKIANLREVKWESMQMNFLMVFPESSFRGAPVSYLGVVHGLSDEGSIAFEREIVGQFPNVTPLRVAGFVEEFRRIFTGLSWNVQMMGIFAILSGLVVLAGVILANHEARFGQFVILKVTGMTRWEFCKLTLAEYGILGFLGAAGSIVVGAVVSYFVVSDVMQIDWYFSWFGVLVSIVALGVSLLFGGASSWMILRRKIGVLLRNE